MSDTKPEKPLGHKAYGSIPHLPGSRRGPADHGLSESQSSILTVKTRDKHDRVIVEEKLDGSCCSVANIGGEIVALIRAGYRASGSNYETHHVFDQWVAGNREWFLAALKPGQRFAGEWLHMAHGTIYNLPHGPFVVFDLFTGTERETCYDRDHAAMMAMLPTPALLHNDFAACSVESAMEKLGRFGFHGATDPVEGAVWRVERNGKFDFIGKFVRPGKVDGFLLPERSGQPAILNWKPI